MLITFVKVKGVTLKFLSTFSYGVVLSCWLNFKLRGINVLEFEPELELVTGLMFAVCLFRAHSNLNYFYPVHQML